MLPLPFKCRRIEHFPEEMFLTGGSALWRSEFVNLNNFQSYNILIIQKKFNKIKISMTCISKEYKIKTKMTQEQLLQLKIKFSLGYILENLI